MQVNLAWDNRKKKIQHQATLPFQLNSEDMRQTVYCESLLCTNFAVTSEHTHYIENYKLLIESDGCHPCELYAQHLAYFDSIGITFYDIWASFAEIQQLSQKTFWSLLKYWYWLQSHGNHNFCLENILFCWAIISVVPSMHILVKLWPSNETIHGNSWAVS
jgi:hypothetical protein